MNPFFVAVFSAVGSTIGETIGYVLGLGGKELLGKKYSKELKKINKIFEKFGSFWWIIITVATPLPTDIAGIFCGMIRYDFKKFLVAVLIGKLISSLIIAYTGYYMIDWVLGFF